MYKFVLLENNFCFENYVQIALYFQSRVVTQNQNERSFHIFYQICAGADETIKSKYSLLSFRTSRESITQFNKLKC